MKKYPLLALLLWAFCTLQAQEQLGIRLSNYGGINSTILNPAYHATTPFTWDVNLVEGAEHVSNDYTYLRNTRLADLLKGPNNLEFEFGPDLPPGAPEKTGAIAVDFFKGRNKRQMLALGNIMGPSFYVQVNENHRIGLITRGRMMASARGIVDPFNYYDYDSRPFYTPFAVDPFRGAVAGWTEVGLNYSYQTEVAGGALAFGITLKALQAFEGSYLRNSSTFELQKVPNDSLGGSPFDFSYAYTTSNLTDGDYSPSLNGGGMGADVGLVYTTYGQSDALYDWKFGFSLIDIGKLNFRRNAKEHRAQTTEPIIISTTEYESFTGPADLEDYVQFFSEQALGDSSTSFSRESFGIWLPSALSIQVDKSLNSFFYIGAAFTQGFPLGPAALQRGSHLAVAPRLEHRWFDASLPVSVYDWEEVRVGLAVRLAFFTIGTSDLGSIVRRSDFNTTDLYFAIKASPFQLFGKREKGFSRKDGKYRSGKKGKVQCYSF
ncbi:MAG: hypothetical protein KDD06_15470 [Phaeodactylibacter sp.]|nr:hypothetical protein [Phaeodactylibacter sp.]MCB9264584.1 hypothetical protein [Lewinellaceae bacterium]MCB9287313.1 hypothetical protein [Lewinellaceae bacterium]